MRFREDGASWHARALLLIGMMATAQPMAAQGSLSSVGFGYPVSNGSTRVNGTAGAFADFDALTPSNGAVLGGLQRIVLGVQAEPEYRTLRVGTIRERTTAQRIPLIAVLLPAGKGVGVGFSASSLLDRSYSTRTTGAAVVGGNTVPTTDQLDVRGAIGTMQAMVGWQINSVLKVGAGGHLMTGDNTVARERRFADTLNFGGVLDSSRVSYFGTALSVGGEIRIAAGLLATASYRMGNGVESRIRDTVRTRADVPNRLAGSLRFEGIPGSVFAIGFEQIGWSRMASLGSAAVRAQDATNWHAGGEVAGPRLRGYPVMVRAGYARTQLPFSPTAARVNEQRISAGLGLPVARDAASIDLSIARANRVLVGGGAREQAWQLGIGLQVRP